MKTRFSTYDVICSVTELQKYVGLRVNQVYDIDNKTYLIRLQQKEEKVIILIESGNRIHSTDFEWPKNSAPSGFSMKLRKHLKNKRLESISQVGIDRIIDLQFGSGEAAHHVFLELFDRGNIMLTDHELTILYVLRPHTQGDRYVFAVREKYPIDRAHLKSHSPTTEELLTLLKTAKLDENLKKVLAPHLEYGPALIDHALLGIGLTGTSKIGKDVIPERDVEQIAKALLEAEEIIQEASKEQSKGIIIQKKETRPFAEGGEEELIVNVEFHPMLFRQHYATPHQEFDSFDKCVDTFFSSLESQKIDMKMVQQERDAVRKLENVRRDHNQRLQQLEETKTMDKLKAELITKNRMLVDEAIHGVRAMVASQIPWPDIQAMVKKAAALGDSTAACIKALKLDTNHIVLQLTDPYDDDSPLESEDDKSNKPVLVDIDLDLSAFANARRFYDQKRTATKKQQKTLESQGKALKSAEKKTKKCLQEMKSIVNITKARKVLWFEKFFWFISSENYLVIAGRDAVQNELIVKRYMRSGDVYVHADIHGASSIIIKNPSREPVPPKTLNEAGVMAICYSVAWEAKVITTAWWVHSDQVLKSAPAGEYLSTGSFSIRGKKNYLPPTNLILGFSFLFKLEESSIPRHAEERKVRTLEEDIESVSVTETDENDVEVVFSGGEEDASEEQELKSGSSQNNERFERTEDVQENKEEDDGSSSSSSGEDNSTGEEGPAFPDTEVKILHSGTKLELQTLPSALEYKEDTYEDSVVYLGDGNPVILKRTNKAKPEKDASEKKSVSFQPPPQKEARQETKLKRGQRSKLKKIKEKYKDQDEEDNKLRMEFLQAASSKKKNSRKEKKKEAQNEATEKKKQQPRTAALQRPKDKEGGDGSGEEEESEPTVNADVDVVSSLTGIPHPDDELLFAVPVVAPYTTLQSYKFKVKITPGTGKRGKAARSALAIFLKDKSTSLRERELLKGVKDEELARNLPGKVKVSAAQLHKK